MTARDSDSFNAQLAGIKSGISRGPAVLGKPQRAGFSVERKSDKIVL
jgi:hypothetical protein